MANLRYGKDNLNSRGNKLEVKFFEEQPYENMEQKARPSSAIRQIRHSRNSVNLNTFVTLSSRDVKAKLSKRFTIKDTTRQSQDLTRQRLDQLLSIEQKPYNPLGIRERKDSFCSDESAVPYYRPDSRQQRNEAKGEMLVALCKSRNPELRDIDDLRFNNLKSLDKEDAFTGARNLSNARNKRQFQSLIVKPGEIWDPYGDTKRNVCRRSLRKAPSWKELMKQDQKMLSEIQIKELFKARCMDLKISEEKAYHMFDNFKAACIDSLNGRKLKMINLSLGFQSSRALKKLMLHEQDITSYILSDNHIGDNGVMILTEALKNTRHIVKLDLSCNGLTHLGGSFLFEALKKNESVVEVNLSSKGGILRNTIQAKGCIALSQLIQMNPIILFLNLQGNGIQDEGVKHLADAFKSSKSVRALQSLNISDNEITHNGCIYVRSILEQSNLFEIFLGGNSIGDKGALKFYEALFRDRTKLKKLDLTNCKIGHTGLLKILESVTHNFSIETLILDQNLGTTSRNYNFKMMQQFITQNKALAHFRFAKCALGDSFACPLGDGLQHSLKIQTLNLSHNRIGNEGATSIAGGLINRFNGQLRELNLSYNKIGDEGGRKLAVMLLVNRSVRYCSLSHNSLTEESGDGFIKAAKNNILIEQLDLNCNLYSLRQIQTVSEYCMTNMRARKERELPHNRAKLESINNVKLEIDRVHRSLFETEKATVVETYYRDQIKFQHTRMLSEQNLKTSSLEQESRALDDQLAVSGAACDSERREERSYRGMVEREAETLAKRIDTMQKDSITTFNEICTLKEQVNERKSEHQKKKQGLFKQILESGIQAEIKQNRYKAFQAEKLQLLGNDMKKNTVKIIQPSSKVTFASHPDAQSKYLQGVAKLEATSSILFVEDQKYFKQAKGKI